MFMYCAKHRALGPVSIGLFATVQDGMATSFSPAFFASSSI
jgi:hypothetical protein